METDESSVWVYIKAQMVAENYKIKVPGVMKNHILGVHVLLAVLKMTRNVKINIWMYNALDVTF